MKKGSLWDNNRKSLDHDNPPEILAMLKKHADVCRILKEKNKHLLCLKLRKTRGNFHTEVPPALLWDTLKALITGKRVTSCLRKNQGQEIIDLHTKLKQQKYCKMAKTLFALFQLATNKSRLPNSSP